MKMISVLQDKLKLEPVNNFPQGSIDAKRQEHTVESYWPKAYCYA